MLAFDVLIQFTVCGVCLPVCRARRQVVAQEMEGNCATADLMAGLRSAWLLLSFSQIPVRHPVHLPGRETDGRLISSQENGGML